jgi:hypothetical protein
MPSIPAKGDIINENILLITVCLAKELQQLHMLIQHTPKLMKQCKYTMTFLLKL